MRKGKYNPIIATFKLILVICSFHKSLSMLEQPPADFLFVSAESRSRASIAVPSYEHAISFKRPHSTISNSSTSSSSSQSSSSLLGSLNLHLYSSPSHPYPAAVTSVPSFAQWPYDCIEEDELEQDTGSQPSISEPQPTTSP